MDYTSKTYGRNEEVLNYFHLFKLEKDISQHGPRRLGKTFVLDRMVDQAAKFGFICVKVEVAGCREPRMVFQRLCEEINTHRSVTQRTKSWLTQRISQAVSPRSDQNGPWYQPFINLDWETHLERLLAALQEDKEHRWAILIDELPIFLKVLHDKGEVGVQQARDFMNMFSSLRSKNPRVRWLVTGSIGIEPLARVGNYMGVMAKFSNIVLAPLSESQAIDYLQDLAQAGALLRRQKISNEEAQAIIEAVGWRVAFYLEVFAQQLTGIPETEPDKVKLIIDAALNKLIDPHQAAAFGTWEEHIHKHYIEPQKKLSLAILNILAKHESGLSLDTLIAQLARNDLDKDKLKNYLQHLVNDGFLYQKNVDGDTEDIEPYRFRIAILRLWWKKFPAQAHS